MKVETVPLIVAAWGAILSTLLGAIKLWEIWRDRHRIDVAYSFATDESVGNTISIRNLSGRPLILSYWELLHGTGSWPLKKFEGMQCPDHDIVDCKIDAYSTHLLRFCDENHFAWSSKVLKGREIYIRLHFAGRKPTLRLVYPVAG
jgi:hypothetical protein